MMPHRMTCKSAGHSLKESPTRSENATLPAVSTTLQMQSLWCRAMDATSVVGSARPPVKWQQRSQYTSQSSEDLAGSWQLMAQNMPTIVQVILDALPSRSPTPVQASDAEVVSSPDTSGDTIPSKLLDS